MKFEGELGQWNLKAVPSYREFLKTPLWALWYNEAFTLPSRPELSNVSATTVASYGHVNVNHLK